MKPGYKTTEFWLSVLAAVGGFLLASGAFGEQSAAVKAIEFGLGILATMGYTAVRGATKKAEALAVAEAVKKQ